MIKNKLRGKYLILLLGILSALYSQNTQAQGSSISGTVYDQSTNQPLGQVLITVLDDVSGGEGTWAVTDQTGNYELESVKEKAQLVVQLPGYRTRQVFAYGRSTLDITMVKTKFKSMDDFVVLPLAEVQPTDLTISVDYLTAQKLSQSSGTSFDQEMQGNIPGLNAIGHSGMPGHRSWMNIRGNSSMVGRNEPLMIIDGMIHETNYLNSSAIEGFLPNPMDVLDVIDIEGVSVIKDAQSFLGGKGSNGVIYINTEQKKETSTEIKFNFQGGVATLPSKIDLLNPEQFKGLFNSQLTGQGLNQSEIDALYPWLNGGTDAEEYFRYNNNTDWQDEIFKVGALQKYHFFLKGGDDIATYNISTGYVNHKGIVDNSGYSRYNLRLNGIINITNKFSITPNAKLGLATTRLQEQGYNKATNPILASHLKPSIMAPFTRSTETGEELSFLDDVGTFDLSNPAAIVQNLQAENVNFHFLASAKAQYDFSAHLKLASTFGMGYNNSRDNIFIPDYGIEKLDSALNTVRVMVTEFQSFQNNTRLSYENTFNGIHSVFGDLGFWYMKTDYETDMGTDLNSPTDDFSSLGSGAKDQFLRTSTGGNRRLKWVSYSANLGYSYMDKYYINGGFSMDASSAMNSDNTYNMYPSGSAAWKLSSEDFLNSVSWIDELKIRGSYGLTGNTYSTVYDYSRLYYVATRLEETGVLVREAIPNNDLAMEKRSMMGVGVDLYSMKQKLGLHIDYFMSSVNNLIILQTLDQAFGYNDYYDNGGTLNSSGIEIMLDTRLPIGKVLWNAGLSVSTQVSEIARLDFISGTDKDYFISSIEGAELITKVGEPMFSFYGYETNGVFSSSEAGQVVGPNGYLNEAGDVKFVDKDGNNIIDENDKTIIGNPNAQIFGGFFNSFYYRNFSLDLNFTFNIGNDLYNHVRMRGESMDDLYSQRATVTDRWTGDGSSSDMPRNNVGDGYGNNVFSDRWIEDGSYLRLKNICFSYTFPQSTKVYKNLQIYATATNLLTVTKYTGYDPEFMFNNNPEYMGVDYGKVPHPRTFVVGVKLGL